MQTADPYQKRRFALFQEKDSYIGNGWFQEGERRVTYDAGDIVLETKCREFDGIVMMNLEETWDHHTQTGTRPIFHWSLEMEDKEEQERLFRTQHNPAHFCRFTGRILGSSYCPFEAVRQYQHASAVALDMAAFSVDKI